MFRFLGLLNNLVWIVFLAPWVFVDAQSNISASSPGHSVHFDIDASTGNKTDFALSAFVETNVNRADDGGLYAVRLNTINRHWISQPENVFAGAWWAINACAVVAPFLTL
jgi:hypothetical protein